MREILTVIKGNIRKNKGSYISVAILMFVVSIALTTAFSVIFNTNKRDAEQMDSVGLGNIMAAIDYEYNGQPIDEYYAFCDELANKMLAVDGVESIDKIPTVIMNIVDVNGEDGNGSLFVYDYKSEYLTYNIYDENDKLLKDFKLNEGEIIVPVSFKSLYNTEIGDAVTLELHGWEQEKENYHTYKIAAYMEDPYMGSSVMGIKTLLLCDEDIASLCEKDFTKEGNALILSVHKNKESKLTDAELEAKLNQETSYAGYTWITLTKTQAYNYMTMITNIFVGILVAFIVMLVVATIIVLSHNISSSIEHDFVNLGILKAVGMTNTKIRISIMLGYLFAGLVGVNIGVPVSIPFIAAINKLIRPVIGLYPESTPALLETIITLVVIFVIITVFIAIKLIKISRITPVSAINGGRKDVHFSSLFKLPISKKALGTSLAYRQLVSGKKQYIGAVLITAILTLFMVMISDMCIYFSDENKVNDMFAPVEYDMYTYATQDSDWEEKLADAETIIAKYTDYKKFMYTSKYVLLNDTQIWCGINSEPEYIKNVYEGRTCTYDNEIVVTEYMTDNYGLEIGDKVTISLDGKSADYIVSGYYQCTNDVGKNITMSLEGYYRLVGEPEEGDRLNYVYDLEDDEAAEAIYEEITAKYSEEEVYFGYDTDFSGDDVIIFALYGITILIYILSGIFIAITVVLVCSKIFAKEKQDYGIYKAIGFTSAKLRRQFAIRFVICACIGAIIGIICTLLFSDSLLSLILKMFGMYNFSSSLNIAAAIIPVVFMSLMYYLFSYIVSKKMKKVTPRILINE
ncbi:MAG: FtsX-like permease family protein [Lachnospiraceae bacterium]|nr:FtsX-like permease family protein [Lachnospiraceae bacterium]